MSYAQVFDLRNTNECITKKDKTADGLVFV